MKFHSYIISLYVLLLCVAINISGCATFQCSIPKQSDINYETQNKIKLNVRIEITDSIKEAKWTYLKHHTYELGENFSNNIRTLASKLFENFIIQEDETVKPLPFHEDAILVADFLRAEGSTGIWATEEAVTTIILKWTLINPDGEIIWVDTVIGEAKTISGFGAGSKNYIIMANTRLDESIKDLFKKSYETIYSASAIKKLASQKD